MKKILASLLLLASSIALAATLSPVQLLNPSGSITGQAIVSTGASTAPSWGDVPVTAFASQAANTIVANATGSAAKPTAFAMPSCSTSASILQYTSGTGFACNTGLFTSNFASPSAIGSTTPAAGTFTTLRANSHAKVRASSPTAQSIAQATVTDITNWTELQDTSNSFVPTTGVFTAPRTGSYLVTAQVSLASAAWGAINQNMSVIVAKNGSLVTQAITTTQAAATFSLTSPTLSNMIDMAAGDTLKVQTFQNSGGAINTVGTTNTYMTITEMP